ncbi:hypothetical protein ACFWMR_02145 [Amycolatopsis thailandensis]|uniref:hypothetical protein n=1 Tax=Amycolatopsis thailandensis TaxID=589330 RepID=UPI00366561EB
MNINVIRMGELEVTMPASATVGQRQFVRNWLANVEAGSTGSEITVEPYGADREIRVAFFAGDGQRQQMVVGPDGDGSYAEGPYVTTE